MSVQPLISVCDFETTGFPPDAAVVEAATIDVQHFDTVEFWEPVRPWLSLCNPGRFIPPEASAVHHIVDADVRDAPTSDAILKWLATRDVDIWCAHNAAFERAFFDPAGAVWIDTWKCALVRWPDAPSHKNQALRYWLNLPVERSLAEPGHRAPQDAYVTAWLLIELLRDTSVEQLVDISAKPALLPKVYFGKHQGKRWSEVPADYLEWCLRQDMDADVKHTCRHHLQRHLAATDTREPPPIDPQDIRQQLLDAERGDY